jgi:hypothetical protein
MRSIRIQSRASRPAPASDSLEVIIGAEAEPGSAPPTRVPGTLCEPSRSNFPTLERDAMACAMQTGHCVAGLCTHFLRCR